MALFYITGTSGSGKSSVCAKFQSLSYQAYDTDESINEWHDKKTGEIVAFKSTSPADTTRWVERHDFLMPISKIQKLRDDAKNTDIFICGHASNDIDFMGDFAKVFCLCLSEEQTRQRLADRMNNGWGNDPEQVALLMKWYVPTLERYRRVGAIMIDANRPIEEVVHDILERAAS
jgi:broad-specificity NMP kinase